MALSGTQVTRLGLYGGTRGLYGSFEGKTEQEIIEVVAGGVRKRKIKVMPKHFFPWEQEEDEYIEEVIKDLKRPILKIVKRAPQPDFDSTLEGERLNQEIIKELKRVEKLRKKKAQRRKAIEMLLLS